jgi:hypothetical protein
MPHRNREYVRNETGRILSSIFKSAGGWRAAKKGEGRRGVDLQKRWDTKRQEFESSAQEEVLSVMHRATEDLRNSGMLNRAMNSTAYRKQEQNSSWKIPAPFAS